MPRCSLLIKSAIVPPPSTIGAPPKQPMKNRKTTNWPIPEATAAAILKITKRALQTELRFLARVRSDNSYAEKSAFTGRHIKISVVNSNCRVDHPIGSGWLRRFPVRKVRHSEESAFEFRCFQRTPSPFHHLPKGVSWRLDKTLFRQSPWLL